MALAVIVCGAAFFGAVSVAAAGCDDNNNTFCNRLVYPNTYCWGGTHTYSGAMGQYPGSGTLNSVCAKLVGANSGATYSYGCNTYPNTGVAGVGSNCSTLLDAAIWHGSSNRHTLVGTGIY